MVGDLTYNSFQDLQGGRFFSSWLCLWPITCWKFFPPETPSSRAGALQVLLLTLHLPLVSSMRKGTESSACTTLPFGVKIGKCCTPRCNGRDGDLDGLALVAMVEPLFFASEREGDLLDPIFAVDVWKLDLVDVEFGGLWCILSTNCFLKMRKAQGYRRSWRYLALKGLQYYDSRWVCLKWDMGYPDKKHGVLSSISAKLMSSSDDVQVVTWHIYKQHKEISERSRSYSSFTFWGIRVLQGRFLENSLCSMGPLSRDDTSKGACFMLKYGSFIHLYPSICWKDHLQENQYISAVQ